MRTRRLSVVCKQYAYCTVLTVWYMYAWLSLLHGIALRGMFRQIIILLYPRREVTWKFGRFPLQPSVGRGCEVDDGGPLLSEIPRHRQQVSAKAFLENRIWVNTRLPRDLSSAYHNLRSTRRLSNHQQATSRAVGFGQKW